MADNNFAGVIESLMKGMNAVIGTKTVVGDATQIGDTIILPLVDIRIYQVLRFLTKYLSVLCTVPRNVGKHRSEAPLYSTV